MPLLVHAFSSIHALTIQLVSTQPLINGNKSPSFARRDSFTHSSIPLIKVSYPATSIRTVRDSDTSSIKVSRWSLPNLSLRLWDSMVRELELFILLLPTKRRPLELPPKLKSLSEPLTHPHQDMELESPLSSSMSQKCVNNGSMSSSWSPRELLR